MSGIGHGEEQAPIAVQMKLRDRFCGGYLSLRISSQNVMRAHDQVSAGYFPRTSKWPCAYIGDRPEIRKASSPDRATPSADAAQTRGPQDDGVMCGNASHNCARMSAIKNNSSPGRGPD